MDHFWPFSNFTNEKHNIFKIILPYKAKYLKIWPNILLISSILTRVFYKISNPVVVPGCT